MSNDVSKSSSSVTNADKATDKLSAADKAQDKTSFFKLGVVGLLLLLVPLLTLLLVRGGLFDSSTSEEAEDSNQAQALTFLRDFQEKSWDYVQRKNTKGYTWEAFAFGPTTHEEPLGFSPGTFAHEVVSPALKQVNVPAGLGEVSVAVKGNQQEVALATLLPNQNCLLVLFKSGSEKAFASLPSPCLADKLVTDFSLKDGFSAKVGDKSGYQDFLPVGHTFFATSKETVTSKGSAKDADGKRTVSFSFAPIKGATSYSLFCSPGFKEVKLLPSNNSEQFLKMDTEISDQKTSCTIIVNHPFGKMQTSPLEFPAAL